MVDSGIGTHNGTNTPSALAWIEKTVICDYPDVGRGYPLLKCEGDSLEPMQPLSQHWHEELRAADVGK